MLISDPPAPVGEDKDEDDVFGDDFGGGKHDPFVEAGSDNSENNYEPEQGKNSENSKIPNFTHFPPKIKNFKAHLTFLTPRCLSYHLLMLYLLILQTLASNSSIE